MLIFDGDCGFCTMAARWVEPRLDGRSPVVAGQFANLEPLGLTSADTEQAVYWVDADGGTHRGHVAIAWALIAVGGAWRPVGWLIKTPPVSWIARLGYALVARYRHRLPGHTSSC